MPPSAERVDYHAALRDIAISLVRLKRPERLLKMITRFLYKELGLTHVAICVFDPEKSYYTIFDSQGTTKLPRALLRFDLQHPLVRWFQSKEKTAKPLRGYLTQDRIHSYLHNGASKEVGPETKKDLIQIEHAMKDLRVQIAIPDISKMR